MANEIVGQVEMLNKLKEPFKPREIEWRIMRAGVKDGKPWGMVLPYITSRAVMDRLDEVFGPLAWADNYTFNDKGVLCTINVFVEDHIVSKTDGAPYTEIEPFKGGISDAFKRAGVKWGIGRYLYAHTETFWANFNNDGKYSVKINDRYYKWSAPIADLK